MKANVLTAVSFALALVLGACTNDTAQQRLASAKDYLQKNDVRAAVIEIKNALQKDPELGEARYLLGSSLLKNGDAVAAEVELRKALAVKYPAATVVPDLARSMLMLGQAKKLVDEFGSTRLGQPAADASLQSSLTMAYAALGKREQVESALNAALAADPTYSPALLLSARRKAGSRDFDGALAIVGEVIARESSNADAWKLRGDLLLYTQDKPEEALAAYRRTLEISPTYARAHLAILAVLFRQGKLDEASKQIDQLKQFAAKSPQTLFAEAQLAYYKKDFKRARELSQQLLQLSPRDPALLQLAGAVELQLGSMAQAEIYLSNALQAAPQLALARRLLITTYLRSGQSAKALTALTVAADKNGMPPEFFALAGEVYLQNGDARRAEEFFAKALKSNPDDARIRTALAITQLASGQAAAGLEELHNIAESDAGVTADLALISAHLRRSEFAKALAAIDKLEQKQPDRPAAANLRGRVQLLQKDNVAARKSFEKALAIDPSFFAAAASLASMDLADKKPDQAKKRFEGVLAKSPKNAQALLALAQLAAINGEDKTAVASQLGRAIEANPSEIAPRLLLIDLLLKNKDYKQALAAAQSAVNTLPNSPELLAALGRTQQDSGDINQAIATYGRLIAMQPLSPQPHIRMAEAQMANKDNRAAEQSLRKALEIKPDLIEAQRGLVLVLIQSKKYQDAMVTARRMQEQRPRDAMGYVLEGDIGVARRDWDSATKAFRSGLQHAQDPILAIKLHSALVESGNKAEADRYATSWMNAHPKDPDFLSYMGSVELARKDYSAAARSYLAVLKIQPKNALAMNNLAWIHYQTGDKDALELAQRANELVPNQPALMDTLATILSARGEHARAIELQQRALAIQPDNFGIKLNLARIYIASGDTTRARSELEALAKLDAKYPQRAEATELLKAL